MEGEKIVALKHYKRTRRIMRGEEERSAPVNRRVERSALRSATEAVQPVAPWWERLWWRVRGRR